MKIFPGFEPIWEYKEKEIRMTSKIWSIFFLKTPLKKLNKLTMNIIAPFVAHSPH